MHAALRSKSKELLVYVEPKLYDNGETDLVTKV
jgi:hypothetical protein